MYKHKKAVVFAVAMILAVGNKGIMTNAAIKSAQGVYNLNMYEQKTDEGTFNSMDGIWNTSLVVSGNTTSMSISFNKLANPSVRLDARGLDENGKEVRKSDSAAGLSSATISLSFPGNVTYANGRGYLNGYAVSNLTIE